jgi:hypothetical protein
MEKQNSDADRKAFNREAARELHLGHIDRRWEAVAAAAWKGYMAQGRWALLLTTSAESGGEWVCIYMSLGCIEDLPMREELDMIKSYDPKEEVVALFLTPPANISAYRGGLAPERMSPPEAYRRFRHVLNRN